MHKDLKPPAFKRQVLRVIMALSLSLAFFQAEGLCLYLDLDAARIEQAIAFGRDLNNALNENSEWAMAGKRTPEAWLEVMTKFRRLALAGRKNKQLSERAIRQIIHSLDNKLIFRYYHYSFDKFFSFPQQTGYSAHIRTAHNRFIYPLRDKQNELYLEFTFSAKDILPEEKIFFVIREPSGHTSQFVFDLSKIR